MNNFNKNNNRYEMLEEMMNHPMVRKEKWEEFTAEDHHVWNILFNRQVEILQNRAAPEIVEGLKNLQICSKQIPKISEINEILNNKTNFSVVPVKGFIPEELFFKFLSKRKFPSTCFIRKKSQLDYLEEPDIFHDVFGHVPLLADKTFADFMQAFGEKGLEALECGMIESAAALYWFTVEFGLIKTNKINKIYGAGILSSKGEAIYSIESKIPKRLEFDLMKVITQKYSTDKIQEIYFVIQSFSELFNMLNDLNWAEIKKNLQ